MEKFNNNAHNNYFKYMSFNNNRNNNIVYLIKIFTFSIQLIIKIKLKYK